MLLSIAEVILGRQSKKFYLASQTRLWIYAARDSSCNNRSTQAGLVNIEKKKRRENSKVRKKMKAAKEE